MPSGCIQYAANIRRRLVFQSRVVMRVFFADAAAVSGSNCTELIQSRSGVKQDHPLLHSQWK